MKEVAQQNSKSKKVVLDLLKIVAPAGSGAQLYQTSSGTQDMSD
jgi:hypothetical protein